MRNIILFAEDAGHEEIIRALVRRLAEEHAIDISFQVRSATGGHGKVIEELRRFLRDLSKQEEHPDLLLVGIDANCKGYVECKREVDAVLANYPMPVACAIPDPHVERWLLLDGAAFRTVLGKGCNAPNQKCDRDRYKMLLREAIREAGTIPLFGGIEHSEDIIQAMDLTRAAQADESFSKFRSALNSQFLQWKNEDGR